MKFYLERQFYFFVKESQMIRFMAVIAVFAIVACTGKSPTELSQESNLTEAPADAHTLSFGEVTVKFWHELTPGRGSAITPGNFDLNIAAPTYTVRYHCRRSRYVGYIIRRQYEHIASDETGSGFRPFGEGSSMTIYGCATGSGTENSGNISLPSFRGLREVRIRAWLRPEGQPFPDTPDAVFTESVGWSVR